MRIKLACCKQTDSRRRNRTQQEEDENGECKETRIFLCGPVMRSNCCCDWRSTTRHVSCKKGSISSAVGTRACSPPLLLLLLWDVAGFRGQRQEVEGWGDGVIVWESMQIRRPHENGRAVLSDFSSLRPGFKKNAFSGSVWTVGQNEEIRLRFSRQSVFMWTAPESLSWPTGGLPVHSEGMQSLSCGSPPSLFKFTLPPHTHIHTHYASTSN